MFAPIMTVLGHWWFKRRGLAYGIVALGSSFGTFYATVLVVCSFEIVSVGGVAIPIMVRRLIPQVG